MDLYKIRVSSCWLPLVVLYTMWLAAPAIAQDCLNPGETIHKAAHIDGVGWLDGEIEGDRLIVRTFSHLPPLYKIEQFDITDPLNPVQLGELSIPGQYREMTVDGQTAVLTENSNPMGCLGTLLVVDLSTDVPTDFTTTPRVDGEGSSAHGVLAHDGILYSVTSEGCEQLRLDLFDIADPTDDRSGLGFVLLPVFGKLLIPHPTRIAVRDGYAFLIVDTGDFLVVDVSDPTSPVFVEQMQLPAGIARIEIYGSYAYVMREGVGLSVVDIGDPGSPTLVNTVAIGGRDLGVHEDRLYVFHPEGLGIYDLQDPVAPTLVGWLDYVFDTTEGIAFRDDLAYVGHVRTGAMDAPLGVEIFDLSSGELAQPLYELSVGANAGDLELVGTTAYITRGAAGGIARVELADLLHPELLPRLGMSHYVSVAAEGSGLAAVTSSSLHLYEISPLGAALRSVLSLGPGPVLQVELEDELCAVRTDGLTKIVDVTDPDNPIPISSVASSGDFSFHGDLLAIPTINGTGIYSLADPSDPVLTAHLPVGNGTPIRCEIAGSTLLVAEVGECRIRVYDLTDPSAPEPIVALPYARAVPSAWIDGSTVFVSSTTANSTVEAWDISNPASPAQIYMARSATLNLNGDLLDGHPVIAAGNRGIAVFPSVCRDPSELPAQEGDAWTVEPSRILVSPSPSDGTRLTFSWPGGPSDDRIDIIDVSGRRVHTVEVPRDDSSVDWIAPARSLMPGVYWARWASRPAAGARFIVVR